MNEHVLKTKKYIHAACLLYVVWVVAELAAALGLLPGLVGGRERGAMLQILHLFGVATRISAALALRGIASLVVDGVAARTGVAEK
jgi:hypothetical protein